MLWCGYCPQDLLLTCKEKHVFYSLTKVIPLKIIKMLKEDKSETWTLRSFLYKMDTELLDTVKMDTLIL